jgi:hypothetical protein
MANENSNRILSLRPESPVAGILQFGDILLILPRSL